MSVIPHKDDENYDDQEIARRRDEVIKRMLATPPKRHSELKLGKAKAKTTTRPAMRRRGRASD